MTLQTVLVALFPKTMADFQKKSIEAGIGCAEHRFSLIGENKTLRGALSILQQNVLTALIHVEAGENGAEKPDQALHHIRCALPTTESLIGSGLIEHPVCDRCDTEVHKNYSKYVHGTLCYDCYVKEEIIQNNQKPAASERTK